MQVWLENIETLFLVGTNLRGGGAFLQETKYFPLPLPPQSVQKKDMFHSFEINHAKLEV